MPEPRTNPDNQPQKHTKQEIPDREPPTEPDTGKRPPRDVREWPAPNPDGNKPARNDMVPRRPA
jgi:hypothetical protein